MCMLTSDCSAHMLILSEPAYRHKIPLLLQTLFKSLSMRFRDRLAFAEVRDTKGAIASTFGIASSPALLVIPSEGEPTTYEGERSSFLREPMVA